MKSEKEKLKMPARYFEQLSEKVWKKIKQSEVYEELSTISNFVAEHLKKKHLFKTPAGYFEYLPQKTLQALQKQPSKVYSLRWNLAFGLIAASVLFFFILSVFFINPKNNVVPSTYPVVYAEEKTIFTALSLEQDEAHLEAEASQNKEVLLAVAESIEKQSIVQKNTLEQEIDLDKNLENELEKVLENELDNL